MESCDDQGVKKTIRCIICPTGCEILVKNSPESGEVTFEGYSCKRGLEYAKQEFYEPKRIITTTMKVDGGFLMLIPVRTDKPVPKDRIRDILKEIAKSTVNAPIKMGQTLIENVLGLDANIIASRDLLPTQ